MAPYRRVLLFAKEIIQSHTALDRDLLNYHEVERDLLHDLDDSFAAHLGKRLLL